MDDNQREEIMNKLSGEQTTHACPECGEANHCDIAAGKETCWCFEVEERELDKKHNICLCRKCLESKALV